MMSSESLLALEPCGRSRLWDREPDLSPALAKDSYITARGSPESGVSDRDPPGRPSPGPRSSAGVTVETGRGCAHSPIRSSTEGAPGGGWFQPAAVISPRVTPRVTSPGSLVPGGW